LLHTYILKPYLKESARCGLDDAGSIPVLDMHFFFLYATVSRPTLGSIQLPIKWILVFFTRSKAAEAWSLQLTSI